MKKVNVEKNQDSTTDKTENWFTHGIIGIRDLFIITSIALSAAVIFMGTKDLLTWLFTVPMVAWAIYKTIKQFTK